MWQDKVKEIIDILENSNVNEIEVTFWGRKVRVVKNASAVVANNVQPDQLHRFRRPVDPEQHPRDPRAPQWAAHPRHGAGTGDGQGGNHPVGSAGRWGLARIGQTPAQGAGG